MRGGVVFIWDYVWVGLEQDWLCVRAYAFARIHAYMRFVNDLGQHTRRASARPARSYAP